MKYITIVAMITLLMAACSSSDDQSPTPGSENPGVAENPGIDPGTGPEPDNPDPEQPPSGLFLPSLTDIKPDLSVYQTDGYGQVNVIRVDIRTVTSPGICTAEDLSGCTLADVIADTNKSDALTVDIPIHFSSDDFPNDGSVSNAELRQRGGGARFAAQKSFRIKLVSKDVLWRNERHLQLNKHPFDSSRIQNKLAFDLMGDIPHLPSMRTQFVNLWIDDGQGPVDYGLFTHVEKANERHLLKRGFSDEDNLYKAENFTFSASGLQDVAVDAEGKPLDKARFESSLEIESGKDHRALTRMLTALQDPNRSFESVLDQYFNRNNVMTWMVVNILMGQTDATRHNYILYNPAGSDRFYFVPWDYDDAMELWREPANNYTPDALRERAEFGYAVGSQNLFTSKFYRLPGIHNQLIAAAQYLRQNYLIESVVLDKANSYTPLVEPFQARAPDNEHNLIYRTSAASDSANSPVLNEQALKTRFGIPMPPTLLEPTLQGSQWVFSWQPAYEVTGNSVSYDVQVSSSLAFEPNTIMLAATGIPDASGLIEKRFNASDLPSGDYYVRLTARSSNEPERNWQVADNRMETGGVRYYGVLAFNAP